MKSTASSASEYIERLPADRRDAIAAVRAVIRANLHPGFEEGITAGMISYQIPLSRYPSTYNKHPLMYVALAAQKNYNAIYMMRVYGDRRQEHQLRDAFKCAGKKLDMGKSCIRFKVADDLSLDTVGKLVASTTADEWIAIYERTKGKS